MLQQDQQHRKVLQQSSLHLAKYTQAHIDSLHQLQAQLDVINFQRLLAIINKYGCPNQQQLGKEKVLRVVPLVLMHNARRTHDPAIKTLLMDEIKKGHLHPSVFIAAYDRHLIDRGENPLYGGYGTMPCLTNIKEVNKARKAIGLAPFEKEQLRQCQ